MSRRTGQQELIRRLSPSLLEYLLSNHKTSILRSETLSCPSQICQLEVQSTELQPTNPSNYLLDRDAQL